MLINLILTLLLLNPSGGHLENRPIFNIGQEVRTAKPERINPDNLGVEVTADKYAVIDVASGELLASKDVNAVQPIASITKMMTALVILDQKPDWHNAIIFTEADETVGAQPNIYRGEEVKFADVWKTALIASDNNAIMAMVRSLGISRAEFVALMNAKAEQLNMSNSHFADPTGLDTGNVSTALDVGRLIHAAMQKNEIKESVTQGKYSFEILNAKKKRTVMNTDILVDSFLNKAKYGYELVGGKTGFIPEAGYCLAVKLKKDNHELIAVVLHSETINDRFQDIKSLVDWAAGNYRWAEKN